MVAGVGLMIFESGMHFDFEKAQAYSRSAVFVQKNTFALFFL